MDKANEMPACSLTCWVQSKGNPDVLSQRINCSLTCRAEAITMPEADELMGVQLDLPLFESTLDADATVCLTASATCITAWSI